MQKALYLFLFVILLGNLFLSAQTFVPVAFDLTSPIDVNLDSDGQPWITLSGSGFNDGQVVRLTADGSTEVVIEGLPSYFNHESEELQGALSTQVMPDGRILVCQGGGPDSLSGSIMEFHLDDYLAAGSALTSADRRNIIYISRWVLEQGFLESNPYSFVAESNGDFVIADAAANAIVRYRANDESFSIITELPAFSNPLPFGPPFIQAVPTKIIAHPEGGYLISTLTGFPFLDGAASIYRLTTEEELDVYATGLTLLTDMAFDPADNGLLALQFAAFGEVDSTLNFQFGSAQVIKVGPDNQLDTLLSGFGPSPGMAIGGDGTAYFTHLFLGQLLRTDALTSLHSPILPQRELLMVFPNPSKGQVQLELSLADAEAMQYQLIDLLGRPLASGSLGQLSSGEQRIQLDFSSLQLPVGRYELLLNGESKYYRATVIFH